MLEVHAIAPRGEDGHAVRAFVIPIPSCGGARCFGFIATHAPPRTGMPAAHRTDDHAARVVVTIENLAETRALPTDPSAWLPAFLHRIHEHVGEGPHDRGIMWSAIIGLAWETDGNVALALACTGAATAFLMRSGSPAAVMTLAQPQRTVRALHFRHTIEGTMGMRDVLVVGNAALTEVSLAPPVLRALAERPLTEGAAVLARELTAAHAPVTAIIVAARRAHLERPQASMAALVATATTTRRFLTPTLGPVLRRYGERLRTAAALLRPRRRARHRLHRPLLTAAVTAIGIGFETIAIAIRSAGAILIDSLRLVVGAILQSVRGARRGVHHIVMMIRTIRTRRTDPRAVLTALHTLPRSLRVSYGALPRSSRVLLLLTIAFGVLFLASTAMLWRRRVTDSRIAMFHTTIAAIEELRSVAEARLLFHDAIAARRALLDATAHLATLPRDTRARRAHAAALERELAAALDRARSLTRITEPLRVASAGAEIPFPAIGDLVVTGDHLLAIATDGSQFARVNPRDRTVVVQPITPAPIAHPLRALLLDDRTLLLVDRSARLTAVDLRSGSAMLLAITTPPGGVSDAHISAQRLTLLHGDGAVTRHRRTAEGFSRGEIIIPAGRPPPHANAIAGTAASLLVSAADGHLVRFAGGRRAPTDFLSEVDPRPTGTLHLAWPSGNDTVYLGDPVDGRIIAVTTNGALIGQLQSDAFRGLSRIVVDPARDAVYILHASHIDVVVPPKKQRI